MIQKQDSDQLMRELQANNLPVSTTTGQGTVRYSRALTAPEITLHNNIKSMYDNFGALSPSVNGTLVNCVMDSSDSTANLYAYSSAGELQLERELTSSNGTLVYDLNAPGYELAVADVYQVIVYGTITHESGEVSYEVT